MDYVCLSSFILLLHDFSCSEFFFLSIWICSLEKLKPEKELEKAKSRILNFKLKIRALFQSLDQSLVMGKLPESLFDARGEIDSEDVGWK